MVSERRSFFFGTTLSEIGFILFFALLLFAFFQRQVDTDAIREAEAKAEALAAEISAREEALAELQEIINLDSEEDLESYFSELVPRQELALQNRTLVEENRRLKEQTEVFNDLREWIRDASDKTSTAGKQIEQALRMQQQVEKVLGENHDVDPGKLADALQMYQAIEEFNAETSSPVEDANALSAALARQRDLEGQVRNLQGRLGGRDLPPCWAHSATGKIEYLFNVTITDRGLRFTSAAPAYRRQEYTLLPNIENLTQSMIDLEEFEILAKPILDLSDRKQCRHYVAITDRSENSYKATLTIEDYFYKFVNRT